MKISLILACAGKGKRAGLNKNKLLFTFDGKTVLEHTLDKFINSNLIDEIIVSANPDDVEFISPILPNGVEIVLGGDTRTQSVINALDKVTGDIVLVHDGARPFVSKRMIEDCIKTAIKHGGCIPVYPSRDTMVKSDGKIITEYLGKGDVYSVQTPQGFNANHIKNAYANARAHAYNDDGEVYLATYGKLFTYLGEQNNIKLTYPEDFSKLTTLDYRFGTGFDCHRLVEGRKLILGGIEIAHDKGLLGHSDADVLTHAIMDAILSATANRDIGYHFSDKDPAYKDACSMNLLQRVLEMTTELGYKVASVSASIMAEKPKLLKHIPAITENLAKALSIPTQSVGISATTLEGLGFVGREEGICVHATATLVKIN